MMAPRALIATQQSCETEVARALSSVPFAGMDLGHTLDNAIRIEMEMRSRYGPRPYPERIRDWLRYIKWHVAPRYEVPGPPPQVVDRVIVGVSSLERRWLDLAAPVVGAIGDLAVPVCAMSLESAAIRLSDARLADWRLLLDFDRSAWLQEYRKCHRRWSLTLASLQRARTLPVGWRRRLRWELLLASQRSLAFRRFFRRHRPRAVLVDYDRHATLSCMVLAARSLSIPTFTLIHGTPGDRGRGFVPFIADRALCWGALDRDVFVQAGADPSKVIPVGCPRLPDATEVARHDAWHEFAKGTTTSPTVLCAISAHGRSRWREVVAQLDGALQELSPLRGVVRLHPSDGDDVYEYIKARHPTLVVRRAHENRLAELIAECLIVITDGSGVGGDALVLGRPVVVMPGEGIVHGHARVLVEEGQCPLVNSATELAEVLRRFIEDPIYRAHLEERRSEFSKRFCVATGKDAARRIALEVGCDSPP